MGYGITVNYNSIINHEFEKSVRYILRNLNIKIMSPRKLPKMHVYLLEVLRGIATPGPGPGNQCWCPG